MLSEIDYLSRIYMNYRSFRYREDEIIKIYEKIRKTPKGKVLQILNLMDKLIIKMLKLLYPSMTNR